MSDPVTAKQLMLILHSCNGEVVERFSSVFPEEVLKICEHIETAHHRFGRFNAEKDPSERIQQTGAFMFMGFDSLFTSMHLLMQGYLIPSGNMFRQSLEAIAMAALLSEKSHIEVVVKKGWSKRDFSKDYLREMKYTEAHNALRWLGKNAARMKLNESGIEIFKKGKNFYNKYSHPNFFCLGARMVGGEDPGLITGGIYDEEKLEIYKKEITSRESYASFLPDTVDFVFERAKGV
ncbi:MAG: hypothetical protein PVI28_14215 [Gammaproteobacteria bacterium]|jgi:hypothetical protein